MATTKNRLLDDEFIAKIEQLELVSKKITSGLLKGDRLSKRRGYSNEFADFKPYVAGDDLRYLDWNAYGRLERLFLKIFLEEEDLRLNILVDRSPSMDFGDPNKLDYAKKVAAALAYIGLVNQDRVEVATFSQSTERVFGPSRGRRQTRRLLDVLGSLESDDAPGTDLEKSCRDFALSMKGGGIVVVITDFFDRAGFEGALRYLLAAGRSTEVFLLHVLAPEELNPELAGDLRLVDVEDGGISEVSISPALLKRYKETLDTFCDEIRQYCSSRGMFYVPTATSRPFDRLVLDYLRNRGLLK